jgi:hypothetical protein
MSVDLTQYNAFEFDVRKDGTKQIVAPVYHLSSINRVTLLAWDTSFDEVNVVQFILNMAANTHQDATLIKVIDGLIEPQYYHVFTVFQGVIYWS